MHREVGSRIEEPAASARGAWRRGVRAAALLAVVLLAGSCESQPGFTIPLCRALHEGCACQIGGWTICDRVCVDPRRDPANCGGCGQKCLSGQVCSNGRCAADCGAAPRCGDRCSGDDDPFNCGGCGKLCPAACVGGACGPTPAECNAQGGLTACGATCASLFNDPNNCGACGVVCASGLCSGRQCCRVGEVLCRGFCTDIMTSRFDCGRCGNSCPVCVGGVCQ